MDGAMRMLRILAYEPFDAGSHRAVRVSISRHSRHEWMWVARPGRNWKWRMRLAAAEMVGDAGWGLPADSGSVGDAHPAPDAIFVTSLMSAADLRALLPGPMRNVPLLLYMHENQAAYPGRVDVAGRDYDAGGPDDNGDRDVHFALTNLTSILAADRVIWNSDWNRRSFIEGIGKLLRACSDLSFSIAWLAQRIEERSAVVWPPVEPPAVARRPEEVSDLSARAKRRSPEVLHNGRRPVKVVWPHRWEHDKGPDELLRIATRWSDELDLRWTILGERYGVVPPEMIEFEKRLADRIDHFGYAPDRAAYMAKLRECDWVLSTARHEFFGIAVAEALLCGCLPWLPERLSYTELLPELARRLSPMNPPKDDSTADAVRDAIRSHLEPAIAENAVERLDTVVEEVVSRAR